MRSALGSVETTGSRHMKIRWDWLIAAGLGALAVLIALRWSL